jgi:hypothetical protein
VGRQAFLNPPLTIINISMRLSGHLDFEIQVHLSLAEVTEVLVKADES